MTAENAFKDLERYGAYEGTMSFSGADMQAVIFLPMSGDQLAAYVAEKNTELYNMTQEMEAAEEHIRTLSALYTEEEEDYNSALQQYLHYKALVDEGHTEYTSDMNSWEAKTTTDLLLMKNVTKTLSKLSVSGKFALREEINAAQKELKRVHSLWMDELVSTRPIKLMDLQTLSISSHREKFPVRTLGRVYPKSHTRGQRTIAGSMIFTLFNKAALWDLLQASVNFYSTGVAENSGEGSSFPEMSTVLVDQLPPFDITIVCSNELGDNSYLTLYGVEIVNEGLVLSIQDIITENTMQFVAMDYDVMRPLGERRQLIEKQSSISADDLYKERYKELARRNIRLNNFI